MSANGNLFASRAVSVELSLSGECSAGDYFSTSLELTPYARLAEVRTSLGVLRCFRSQINPPVPHAHDLPSIYPIPSILDHNFEYDPCSPFAFGRDRPEGVGFVLRQSSDDVAGQPPPMNLCNASRPNMMHFESLQSPCRTRAPVNPSCRFWSVVLGA